MRAPASTTLISCRCKNTSSSSNVRGLPLPCPAQQIDPGPRRCGQVLLLDQAAEAGVRQPSLRSQRRGPTGGRSTGRARVDQAASGPRLLPPGAACGDQRQPAYRSTWGVQVGGVELVLAQRAACARARRHWALGRARGPAPLDLAQVRLLARRPLATTHGLSGGLRAHRKVEQRTTMLRSWPRT